MRTRSWYRCNLLFLFLIFFLFGCSFRDSEPGITGYVTDITDTRMLVTSSEAQDLSDNGGVNEFYQMIWFSNAPDTVELGDKVSVWYDSLQESYPAQSSVKKYEIIDATAPSGATYSKTDALKKALDQQSNHPSQDFAVRSIDFIEHTATWLVELKDIWSEEVFSHEIQEEI
ncbi:hypothetical protein J2T56_002583 [Natronobacillus azotifigens]|uniref:YobA family protein n=1 Tax=Natronobacillus azotifigens TaxID=472978 RepID=A0A9J6RBT0_9BACI|nr:YobA family protein [Natronobacillus azotifigens]MCZ0702806.1 YobA family protein [Natronobacillus azotifigens]